MLKIQEIEFPKRQHGSGKKKRRRKEKGRTNNGNLKNALLLRMNVEKGHAQTILAG